jgi:hypothetical protein
MLCVNPTRLYVCCSSFAPDTGACNSSSLIVHSSCSTTVAHNLSHCSCNPICIVDITFIVSVNMLRRLASAACASARTSASFAPAETTFAVRTCHGQTSTPSGSIEKQIMAEFDRNPASAARAICRLPEQYRSRILTAIVDDCPEPGSPRYLHNLFKDADRNKDGILDPYGFFFRSFVVWISQIQAGSHH